MAHDFGRGPCPTCGANILPTTPPPDPPPKADAWENASSAERFAVERDLDGLIHGGNMSHATYLALKHRLGL